MKIQNNKSLKDLTAIKIGGTARHFTEVRTPKSLLEAIKWAKAREIPWMVIGGGSNIIPRDKGFKGLIIKIAIEEFKRDKNKVYPHTQNAAAVSSWMNGNSSREAKNGQSRTCKGVEVYAGAGNNLFDFIKKINRFGLAGLEKMAGVPGTIGGAICGNAGAYGQEISNCVKRVKILDSGQVRWISKNKCEFGYRDSIFKKKNWIILGAEFEFKNKNSKELSRVSKKIIKTREKKYWPELLCPGSFFKNIILTDLDSKTKKIFLSKINPEKIVYNKVPAGYLLEEIEAKGMKIGGIRVANHHGNLIYNAGNGKSADVKKLAGILKKKVKEKFSLEIEEEVRYI